MSSQTRTLYPEGVIGAPKHRRSGNIKRFLGV